MKIIKKICLVLLITISLSACAKSDISGYTKHEMSISTIFPDHTFEELSNYSTDIVAAKFKGYTNPFKVKSSEGGSPAIFKDAKFEVLHSYKGDLPEGTIITVRTLGGEVIDHENKIIISTENEDDIKFNNKHEKVLFLTKPKTGPYITNENYYISISGSQGVFDIEDNKLVNLMDTEKVFNIELLDNIDTSVDPEDIEKAQMKYNLEIGSITEEEYEDYIESLDKPIKYAEKEEYNE